MLPDTPALSIFINTVFNLYFLAEFISVSTEKLKSKTAFKGIINDIYHLSYGLRSNCFVTEDDALFKKAVFIKEYLGLNSRIYKLDDINKILL